MKAKTQSLASTLDRVPKLLLIDGQWREAQDGATFEVENPATEKPIATVADGSAQDAVAALDAAVAAQASWSAVSPRDRGEILRRAYEELQREREFFALLMTLEMGKPLTESRGELQYGAEFFRWFSEEAVRISGRWSVAPSGETRLVTMKRPVGPCLLITPWNFPLAMATRKIGPAIAAGCTMVLKPAAETPLTTLALAALLERCGLPSGVLNVITTNRAAEVSTALTEDQRLRKLSFTGSTEVGRLLLGQAASSVLRTSMELGGNAAFLVFDDADLDQAVEGALLAKLRNMGQSCTAANRFYVHESIAQEFVTRLSARMSRLRVGDGLDPDTDIGPLISRHQHAGVRRLVDDARAAGARVIVTSDPLPVSGHFVAPTIVVDPPSDATLMRTEIFGPVAPVCRFATETEAIELANSTPFGLVHFVFTRDLSRAIRVSEALETGMVGLNRGLVSNPAAPFGGAKQSGLGREGGAEGIDEYLTTTYLAIEP
jgi:succinate-semialdehyde dehydrogenase / glutarate-semialdehyde dehydrogenase